MAQPEPVRTRYIDQGGPRLFVSELGPVDASRTLVVVHGYAEHAGRYIDRLRPLAALGWRVILPDLRGHGRSDGPRGHVQQWNDYHNDVERIFALVTTDAAHTAVLGHSNGGLITASWLVANAHRVATAVLSSPLMAIAVAAPRWKTTAGTLVSRLAPRVSLPTEIKPEWVSRDPRAVADYASDPLNHRVINTRWFTEATEAMAQTLAAASRIDVPVLLMQAGADRLVSAAASARLARALPNCTYEEIPGAYHELLFDIGGDEHAERIVRWLQEHVPA